MGNIFNAANQLVEGRQRANALRDQADMVQQDIDRTEINRGIHGQQYSAREETLRRNIRLALGRQRAAVAQSGTGFGGSNEALMAQSTAGGELDALNLRYQGQLERMGMDIDLANMRYNKGKLRAAAKREMRMRWINAASSFFGGNPVSSQAPTTAPTTSSGMYGQGSLGNFGNNMGNFTSSGFGSSGGISGGGLSQGYGSIGGYNSLFGGG